MSSHIDKKFIPTPPPCKPKENRKVVENAVITGKPCECLKEQDKNKVAVLTEQYRKMLAEAEAARNAANAAHEKWEAKSDKVDQMYTLLNGGLEVFTESEVRGMFQ